jgi:putative PIN family toxin of toxin-antitoxin system
LRAVVDNNIFVSALLSPRGAPAELLAACRAGQLVLVTSAPLLHELAPVLGRDRLARRGITPAMVADLLALLNDTAEVVAIPGTMQLCRDPKDDMVIETAIAGAAEIIVSGDRDLLDMAEVTDFLAERGIRVLPVWAFLGVLELLLRNQSDPGAP